MTSYVRWKNIRAAHVNVLAVKKLLKWVSRNCSLQFVAIV